MHYRLYDGREIMYMNEREFRALIDNIIFPLFHAVASNLM